MKLELLLVVGFLLVACLVGFAQGWRRGWRRGRCRSYIRQHPGTTASAMAAALEIPLTEVHGFVRELEDVGAITTLPEQARDRRCWPL